MAGFTAVKAFPAKTTATTAGLTRLGAIVRLFRSAVVTLAQAVREKHTMCPNCSHRRHLGPLSHSLLWQVSSSAQRSNSLRHVVARKAYTMPNLTAVETLVLLRTLLGLLIRWTDPEDMWNV